MWKGGDGVTESEKRMLDLANGIEVKIFHIGSRAFLKVGESSVEVKDYKISSSMHDGTELEVIIPLNGEVTEFLSSAKTESLRTQSLTAKNGAP